jgi:hypothetical protein
MNEAFRMFAFLFLGIMALILLTVATALLKGSIRRRR